MVDATHTRFEANDRSYFSIIKKDIRLKAEAAGFSDKRLGDLDLVVSEMISNLHKYAIGGEILAGLFREGDNQYIELICIDDGPGMAFPQKMLEDGVSTGKTLGMGLGSIKRLSDKFDIYSMKEWGTVILSRINKNNTGQKKAENPKVDIRPIIVTMPGQKKSGDGFYYKTTEQYFKLLVADGLGHGEEANHAVNEAVQAFRACPFHSPAEIIRHIHQSIRSTRGMVGTVVVFDFSTRKWKVAGVGNISTRMSNFLDNKMMMSHNGIIGLNIPHTINDQELTADKYHQITLCSDGMMSRWETNKLTGINRCDLSIQAAAIYKEYARQTDDMSVVMAKINIK
jgi:anti-sigma regulatory factor (Ser/Thr protein kinase)